MLYVLEEKKNEFICIEKKQGDSQSVQNLQIEKKHCFGY